ncbi:MAG: alpha/beta hydrolase [Pseudomonadota bacterium]
MIHAPGPSSTLKEVFTVLDVAGAAASALRLQRLPRCDGQRVLTLPGYGFDDVSLLALRVQLRALGAEATGWGLGINFGQVGKLLPRVSARVREAAGAAGGPVALIGWSLGGYLAREVARDQPALVSRVITLGSPLRGGPRYTVVRSVYESLGYDLDHLDAQIQARQQERPLQVPVTAVYSKRDGIVAWRACIDEVESVTEHVAVKATHLGLCYAPAVLEVIADRLAADLDDEFVTTAATDRRSAQSSATD